MKSQYSTSVLSRMALLLAFALVLPRLQGYHLFTTGGNLNRWSISSVVFTADADTVGGVSFTSLCTTAVAAWNNVTDALDIFGTPTTSAVNFTGANLNTAWGNLTGDGNYELVYDADGSALTAFGLNPASINGYGPSNTTAAGVINDAFFIVTGTRTNFDLLSTMTHELGHILGIAHSTVGMHNSSTADTALDKISVASVPTMHPFSLGTGNTARRTLEPDDNAALRELYPAAGATANWAGIQGEVKRCGLDTAVIGASVRAINTANPAIQITRFTSYDGNAAGRYVMSFIPAGSYRIVVEPIGANNFTLNRFGNPPNSAENDFDFEYLSPSGPEQACTEAIPEAAADIQTVAASNGSTTIGHNIRVQSAQLAFVVDDTGSMGEEISAVRTILNNTVDALAAASPAQPFPLTAVVTFKDDVTKRVVSNNPATLRTTINALFASGGGDCPEAGNAALLVAGRMLRRNGVSIFFTDADTRSDGPAGADVTSFYRSKGVRLFTLLSGTCTGTITPSAPSRRDSFDEPHRVDLPVSHNGDGSEEPQAQSLPRQSGGSAALPNAVADDVPAPTTNGAQPAPATFGGISSATGGFFVAIPGINTGSPSELQRYINVGTNLSISAVLPALALVNPTNVPQGATLSIEVNGSNTNFVAGQSALAVSGPGVTVNSVTVISPTILNANISVAPGATLGFRDLTVTTNLGAGSTETARGIGAINVVTAPTTPQTISVTPSQGAQGQSSLDVIINGVTVTFNSTSTASFGSGVTVVSNTLINSTTLQARINIASGAAIGYRRVTVTTNGTPTADATPAGAFQITGPVAAVPVLTSVTPNSGDTGSTLNLLITGVNTNFQPGTTVNLAGTGITTNSVSVTGVTQLTANITIAPNAPLGFRDVTATSGGQTAAILNAFRVTAPTVSCSVAAAVTIQRSGLRRNAATGRWLQQVTITNNSANNISGTLRLVFGGLSANASVFNPSGNTSCASPAGAAFLTTPVGVGQVLAPGASVSVNVEFVNPTNGPINYTPAVYSGANI